MCLELTEMTVEFKCIIWWDDNTKSKCYLQQIHIENLMALPCVIKITKGAVVKS